MKYRHISRTFGNPFYLNFKKHYCANCGALVKKVKVSKMLNSDSLETDHFDFAGLEYYRIGQNAKFIWTELQCPSCKRQYTIQEMQRIENYKENKLLLYLLMILFSFILFTAFYYIKQYL